ncbi:MAG: trans-aconitate 2-methyltransferase [Methylocystis sp.]|uniref:trans-aconitate 2-methyltransferase n=1 Tax=Methylocystis sp. TaxID=1911079 RepID=UPI003934FC3E
MSPAFAEAIDAKNALNDWNSALYLKFEAERTRAARDLLARVPHCETRRVFDLGCGPGNSTRLLAMSFPGADIVGIDRSDNMLSVARACTPTATFIKEDIADWRPSEPADLIFANAALHFLPDHRRLMTRLVSYLRPGGRLAVQMPNNTHELSHAAMRMVAADGLWAPRLLPVAKSIMTLGPIEEYYNLLVPLSSKFDIWQTVYVHPLDGPDGVVEWFEGSGLRPFLDLLDEDERVEFLSCYRARLAQAYPRQPDGKVLLRYPRMFLALQK